MNAVHLHARDSAAADRESDAAVVGRVRGGDIEAFAILVARHHGRLRQFAERMLGDHDDAEDAVQAAFVRAYSALGRYDERSRFVAWLFTILNNECRALASGQRRRARHVVRDEEAVHRAAAPDAPDFDETPALARALTRLEPLLREAFLLRHVEGLSYEEMMRSTGAGESALKMRVKRACDALRAILEGT